eukprot:554983-Pyramimonas_sp.AAC.1
MIGHLLQAVVQRYHERRLAVKLGWSSGARVCADRIRRITKPNTRDICFDVQGKYRVKRVFVTGSGLKTELELRGTYLNGSPPFVGSHIQLPAGFSSVLTLRSWRPGGPLSPLMISSRPRSTVRLASTRR